MYVKATRLVQQVILISPFFRGAYLWIASSGNKIAMMENTKQH